MGPMHSFVDPVVRESVCYHLMSGSTCNLGVCLVSVQIVIVESTHYYLHQDSHCLRCIQGQISRAALILSLDPRVRTAEGVP